VDTFTPPATPTVWTYRAVYRLGESMAGQWSDPAEITVGGKPGTSKRRRLLRPPPRWRATCTRLPRDRLDEDHEILRTRR
jgi:hypothetical protein